LSVIKGVDSKSRADLIKEISGMGYKIDHAGKKIVRGKMEITTGKEGEQKPQKRTLRKALIAGGEAPVLKTPKHPPIPPNVKGRKIKPDRSKLIAGYPPIPPNVKGRKIKPDRSKLIAGYPPIPPNVKGRKVKPDRSKLISGGTKPVLATKGRGRPKGSKNKPKTTQSY
jgi:hypothetical protein